jgi:hypothetical protein
MFAIAVLPELREKGKTEGDEGKTLKHMAKRRKRKRSLITMTCIA